MATVAGQVDKITSGEVDSNTIPFALGALAILFLIYITAKGELPTYLGFFLWTPTTGDAQNTTAAPTGSTGATGSSSSGATTTTPTTTGPSSFLSGLLSAGQSIFSQGSKLSPLPGLSSGATGATGAAK